MVSIVSVTDITKVSPSKSHEKIFGHHALNTATVWTEIINAFCHCNQCSVWMCTCRFVSWLFAGHSRWWHAANQYLAKSHADRPPTHHGLLLLATSLTVKRKRLLVQSCHQTHVSVCLSVQVNCGKTADWIWMPFGVVSGVGWGMGVFDGGWRLWKGKGSFGGKCGTSHCNYWGLCGIVILCREGWQRGSFQITLGFLVQFHVSISILHDGECLTVMQTRFVCGSCLGDLP